MADIKELLWPEWVGARWEGNLDIMAPITEADALEEDLALTSERGYAVDNVEVEEGVACFAAPVFDYRAVPVAAISVAGPAERVIPKGEELGRLVAETASEVSSRLGYVEATGEREVRST